MPHAIHLREILPLDEGTCVIESLGSVIKIRERPFPPPSPPPRVKGQSVLFETYAVMKIGVSILPSGKKSSSFVRYICTGDTGGVNFSSRVKGLAELSETYVLMIQGYQFSLRVKDLVEFFVDSVLMLAFHPACFSASKPSENAPKDPAFCNKVEMQTFYH